MKIIIYCQLFVLLACLSFGQTNLKSERLKLGDVAKETIQYTDSWNTPQVTQVPALYHVLFYRFKDTLGYSDNADSIAGLEKIISELELELAKAPGFKGLHTECHAHVNSFTEISDVQKEIDQKRKESYENSKVTHGWSFMIMDEKKIKSNSVIHASKIVLVSPKGRILYTGYIGGLNKESISKIKVIRGKLLTMKDGSKTALDKAYISIIKHDKTKVDEAYTNKDGEFELDLPENIAYTLTARPTSTAVDNIILATQTGLELSKFKRTKNGFEFPLLKADISKLTNLIEDDDLSLTITKLSKSNTKNLIVTESIEYASGQFNLDESSTKIIDKVIEVLITNNQLKLEVISHTDAQGDDAANLQLSKKRSETVIDYIKSKGIKAERLTATGKGEKEIRNRCVNGVICSAKEHAYNRRTEFHFIK
ncbi:MAG: OmpA family protein [Sphingobacteriaceae bacterium]|nr:OmpA family protein [Sphingobacteriaceae bacterium]